MQVSRDAREVALIHRIRAACAADLEARFGPGHWALIASQRRVNDEASVKWLYAVALNQTIVATLALTRQPPRCFDLKQFARPEDAAVYLSSMVVIPACQGLGIGSWCMRQADAIAIGWECRALRFDAYDHAAGAAEFYQRNGYRPRGKMVFNKVPLMLFEKVFTGES